MKSNPTRHAAFQGRSVRPDNRSAPRRWNVGLDDSLISEESGEIVPAIDQSEMFIALVLLKKNPAGSDRL